MKHKVNESILLVSGGVGMSVLVEGARFNLGYEVSALMLDKVIILIDLSKLSQIVGTASNVGMRGL